MLNNERLPYFPSPPCGSCRMAGEGNRAKGQVMTPNGFIYRPPGPVGAAFLKSDAFLRGIRGPVGSGKSTVCIMDMLKTAQLQKPVNGRRKYRGVIIRNTYGEL